MEGQSMLPETPAEKLDRIWAEWRDVVREIVREDHEEAAE